MLMLQNSQKVILIIDLGQKNICVFQFTGNFKIGTVGRIVLYLIKSFYMGKMGKQYGQTGKKTLEIL